MVFQGKDPLVHQLHCQQMSIFKQFLWNFIKAEIINEKTLKQLKRMELSEDQGQFLNLKDMFVGSHVDKIVKQIGAKDIVVKDFQKQAAAAYLTCGQYMQKKLPLDNAVASVDPELHFLHMGQGFLHQLPVLEKVILHPPCKTSRVR